VKSLKFLQFPTKPLGHPPLAPPLLRPLLLCRWCQRRFPGHVLSLGRSSAPPPVPSYYTRRPQPERRSSSPSLAFSRACHAVLRLCRCHLAVAMALPMHAPSPPLFWFKSSTGSHSSHSLLVSALSSNSGAVLQLRCPPVSRRQPTSIIPAPPQPSRKLPRTLLTLTSHSPWPDLHRSYLAAVLPFAGKLLSPSSMNLRPSSVQFDYSNSFPSSSCSCQAQASPFSSTGTPSPTSTLPPSPRPPWERPLRSSPPLPKTSSRCALTYWCSLTTPPPTPRRPLTGIGLRPPCPSSPTSQGHMCEDFKSSKGVPARF
jgi:hypothetical protein